MFAEPGESVAVFLGLPADGSGPSRVDSAYLNGAGQLVVIADGRHYTQHKPKGDTGASASGWSSSRRTLTPASSALPLC